VLGSIRGLAGLITLTLLMTIAGPAVSAGASAPYLEPAQDVMPAELEFYVDGVVNEALARDHVAGAVVSVVQDGKVVLRKGYGLADVARGTPVDPARTLFRIGSITKTFTWIMALRARDEGRMSLDAPLNAYLPPAVRIPHQGFSEPVRLRDVMTHTPGFEDKVFGALFLRDPARLAPPAAFLAAHRPARIWSRGQVSAYSNYGAALTGLALEHTGGQPWQDLLETQVLGPAGMTSTTGREPYAARAGLPAPMPPAMAARVSKPYRWTGRGYAEQPFEYLGAFAPAGSISSTADDMARYMRALLDDGRIDGRTLYGPGVAQAIRTPMFAHPGGASMSGGFFQTPMRGGFTAFGHAGGTLAFHSNMVLVPQLRLGVFVATNTETERLTSALAERIVGRFYGVVTPALAPAPGLLGEASRYDGEFITTRRPFHGLEGFAFGFLPTPVRVAAPGYLLVGGQRFAPAEPAADGVAHFRAADHPELLLKAHLDKDGRVARLVSSNGELQRRPWWRTTAAIGQASLATGLVALAVLVGPLSPARRRARQTPVQRWAGRVRALAALLWLVAVCAFAIQLSLALADRANVVYRWPGPLVTAAAAAGLVAGLLSAGLLVLTPAVWGGDNGWDRARKLRFSATVAVFSAFAILTTALGALQPWNP
jgi:CubicO group peptidase (beta-lactamase class C family)